MKPDTVFARRWASPMKPARRTYCGRWRDDESHWISAAAEMTIATDAEPRLARDPRIKQ